MIFEFMSYHERSRIWVVIKDEFRYASWPCWFIGFYVDIVAISACYFCSFRFSNYMSKSGWRQLIRSYKNLIFLKLLELPSSRKIHHLVQCFQYCSTSKWTWVAHLRITRLVLINSPSKIKKIFQSILSTIIPICSFNLWKFIKIEKLWLL